MKNKTDNLLAACQSALAALTQNVTLPANIDVARSRLRRAIAEATGENADKAEWDAKMKRDVLARLRSEGLDIYNSPWSEIETNLARCTAPVLCIETARRLREKEKGDDP